MALNNLGMGIVFTASDLASGVISQLASNFINLDSTVDSVAGKIAGKLNLSTQVLTASLKSLGIGLGIAAVGFAGLATSFNLAAPAGKFEQKLAGIQAIMGETEKGMKKLERAALNAGIATQFSPLEAAEGLQILAQAGLNADKSIKTLNPTLDLAAASLGQLGLDEAGGLAITSMKVFPEVADDSRKAVDLLVRSTTRSRLAFKDLPLAMGIAARGAKTFNASMEDTLIALGEVRNVIPTIERGATSVAVAMEKLATPKARKQLKDLGVDVTDATGKKFRPFLDVVKDLSIGMEKLTEVQRAEKIETIFGARAKTGIIVLMDQLTKRANKAGGGTEGFTKALKQMREEMRNGTITAAAFRDKLLDTFEGQKILLKGTLETIAIAIGQPFAKILKPVVKGVITILNTMLQMFLALPEPVKKFLAGFVVFASVTASVLGLAIAIKALIPILTAVGGFIGAGFLIAFIKVIAIIALVVAAIVVLKKAWDSNFAGIRDLVLPVLQKIGLAFRSLFALISSGKISGELAKELLKAENKGVFKFVKNVFKMFSVVRAFFSGFVDGIIEVFGEISTELEPVFGELGEALFHLAGALFDLFNEVASLFGIQTDRGKLTISTVKDLGKATAKFVKGPLTIMITQIKIAVKWFSAMVETVTNLIDLIKKLGSAFLKSIPGIKQINKIIEISNIAQGKGPNAGKTTSQKALKIAGKGFDLFNPLNMIPGGGLIGEGVSRITSSGASPVKAGTGNAKAEIPSSAPSISSPDDSIIDKLSGLLGSVAKSGSDTIDVISKVFIDEKEIGSARTSAKNDDDARGGIFRNIFGD